MLLRWCWCWAGRCGSGGGWGRIRRWIFGGLLGEVFLGELPERGVVFGVIGAENDIKDVGDFLLEGMTGLFSDFDEEGQIDLGGPVQGIAIPDVHHIPGRCWVENVLAAFVEFRVIQEVHGMA